MKVKKSPPSASARGERYRYEDLPTFDLGYIDNGKPRQREAERRVSGIGPFGNRASIFVSSSFSTPKAGPRGPLYDSQRRRLTEKSRPHRTQQQRKRLSDDTDRGSCCGSLALLRNIKTALVSCVSKEKSFEAPRVTSSVVTPNPKSPHLGVYQLSQAHASAYDGFQELSLLTDDDGVPLDRSRSDASHGPLDFDATFSSTHSTSQPVAESFIDHEVIPMTPRSSKEQSAYSVLPSCVSGRDSVSSYGSESFKLSRVDRRRALARSMWTAKERAALPYQSMAAVKSDTSCDSRALDGSLAVTETTRVDSRQSTSASSRKKSPGSRANTASYADSESTQPFEISYQGSSLRSQSRSPDRRVDNTFLSLGEKRRSNDPPPKPSRRHLSREWAADCQRSHSETIPKTMADSTKVPDRPVPGPQTYRNSSIRNDTSITDSSLKNNIWNSEGRYAHESTTHSINLSASSGKSTNTSILKTPLNSGDVAPTSRESFRVRFHRSASMNRANQDSRQRETENVANRRRSRSADNYVLDGTTLSDGKPLQRRDSKVRVLDLSNPEIVTYEMEETDFLSEFQNDFSKSRMEQSRTSRPRISDDSVDLDLSVRDFLLRSSGQNASDQKLLDGFFNYTMNHRSSTSGSDEESLLSEDSLEPPKARVVVNEIAPRVRVQAPLKSTDDVKRVDNILRRASQQIDLSLKIPHYGNNLFLEGASKSEQDPMSIVDLKDRQRASIFVKNYPSDNKTDNTSNCSQDSSEPDSYTQQLRDMQSRMKSLLGNQDARQGENSSFDSAFDSLERPQKTINIGSAAVLAENTAHLRAPHSISAAPFVPHDVNGNLSTVEEISRASSTGSRDTPETPLFEPGRRAVFSVTSADSNYEFDDDVRTVPRAAVKASWDSYLRSFSQGAAISRQPVTPDDGVVVSPSSESGPLTQKQRHRFLLDERAELRRDSFGDIAPGKVANLRAGFEIQGSH